MDDIDCPERCVESKIKTELTFGNTRKAVFTCDVKKGDVIFRNKPFNSAQLSSELRSERCAYCFCRGDEGCKLSYCTKCAAAYCSRDCQMKDFTATRHKVECRRIADAQKLGFHGTHLDKLLLLMKTGKALLDENIGHNLADECNIIEETNICSCGLKHAGNLSFNGVLTGPATPSYQVINATTSAAVNLLYKKESYKNDNKVFFDMLYHMFDQNNFGVCDELCNTLGSGVFPHAAILNHSCTPNALMRYRIVKGEEPLLECIALADVAAGTECVHSYVDLTYGNSERQLHIKSTYDFECNCGRCVLSDRSSVPASTALLRFCDTIELLTLNPLGLRQFLRENFASDASVLQQICELLTENDTSHRGIEDLDERSSTTSWCSRWHELKQHSKKKFSRKLYGHAANIFTEFVYRYQLNEELDQKFASVLVECSLFVASFITLTGFSGTLFNPMLGLHLFTLADVCKGLQTKGFDAPDPRPFYQWAKDILDVTHGVNSQYVTMLKDNLMQCAAPELQDEEKVEDLTIQPLHESLADQSEDRAVVRRPDPVERDWKLYNLSAIILASLAAIVLYRKR